MLTNKFLSLLMVIIGISATAQAQGRRMRKMPPAGEPTEIQLTPYKTTMLSNGKDTALISVKIIDRDGKEVADAKEHITFKIKGDAKILSISKTASFNTPTDSTYTADITGDCW